MKRVTPDLGRWRRNLQGEVDGAHIYRAMAANACDDRLADLYTRMPRSKTDMARCSGTGCQHTLGHRSARRSRAAAAITFGIGTLLGSAIS